jgi:hypothetical protein
MGVGKEPTMYGGKGSVNLSTLFLWDLSFTTNITFIILKRYKNECLLLSIY